METRDHRSGKDGIPEPCVCWNRRILLYFRRRDLEPITLWNEAQHIKYEAFSYLSCIRNLETQNLLVSNILLGGNGEE